MTTDFRVQRINNYGYKVWLQNQNAFYGPEDFSSDEENARRFGSLREAQLYAQTLTEKNPLKACYYDDQTMYQ